MSGSPGSRRPSASVASQAPVARPGDRWGTAGLALLGVWAALFVVAIALWVRVAFLSEADTAERGLVRLAGAPIVLVALGLLWWAWWSARALRRGRREGWTLLLVLGGVAVVQAVLTSRAVLASPTGTGAGVTPPPAGHPARSSAASWRPSRWAWSPSSSPCWPAAAGRRPTRADAGRRELTTQPAGGRQRPGLTTCSRSRTGRPRARAACG